MSKNTQFTKIKEVIEGIDENAIVVTGGIQKVRDGSKVTIRETDN